MSALDRAERFLHPVLTRALDAVREWTEPSMECPCCGVTMNRLFMRHLRFVWPESRPWTALRASGRWLPEGLYLECHACGEYSAFEPYVGVALDVDGASRSVAI